MAEVVRIGIDSRQAVGGVQQFRRATGSASDTVDRYQAMLKRAERVQRNWGRTLNRARDAMRSSARAGQLLARVLPTIRSGAQRAQRSIRSLTTRLRSSASAMTDAASGMGRLGRIILTGGLIVGIAAITRGFAQFERQLGEIEGLVGVSRTTLAAWTPEIEAIAIAAGRPLNSVAEALFFVTSAGLRGQVALDVLRQSAIASAAGLGEQRQIVDLVTSALNAYGPSALTAADATDQLTKAVELGKLAPETLANAAGRALPIFSGLNVEFSELLGLLAAMSRTGTTAEEGVTSLNAALLTLLKPAAQTRAALESVGLSVRGLRDLAADRGAFAVFETAFDAIGQDVEALAQVFPNIRALRGVFDLLGAQRDVNRQIIADVANAAGKTEEAFASVADSLSFRFQQFGTAVRVAMQDIADRGAPALGRTLVFLTDNVGLLSGGVKLLAVALVAIVPVFVAANAGALALGTRMGLLALAFTGPAGIIAVLAAAAAAFVLFGRDTISTMQTAETAVQAFDDRVASLGERTPTQLRGVAGLRQQLEDLERFSFDAPPDIQAERAGLREQIARVDTPTPFDEDVDALRSSLTEVGQELAAAQERVNQGFSTVGDRLKDARIRLENLVGVFGALTERLADARTLQGQHRDEIRATEDAGDDLADSITSVADATARIEEAFKKTRTPAEQLAQEVLANSTAAQLLREELTRVESTMQDLTGTELLAVRVEADQLRQALAQGADAAARLTETLGAVTVPDIDFPDLSETVTQVAVIADRLLEINGQTFTFTLEGRVDGAAAAAREAADRRLADQRRDLQAGFRTERDDEDALARFLEPLAIGLDQNRQVLRAQLDEAGQTLATAVIEGAEEWGVTTTTASRAVGRDLQQGGSTLRDQLQAGANALLAAFRTGEVSPGALGAGLGALGGSVGAQFAGEAGGVLGTIFGGPAGAALGSTLGSIIGQSIGNLFGGESPEEARRREILEANNHALEQFRLGLIDAADALGSTTGTEFGGIGGALSNALEADPRFGLQTVVFQANLERLGISFERAQQIAAGFGIELNGSSASLQAFHAALQEAEARLFQTAAGQLELARLRADLLDLSPEQQIQDILNTLGTELTGSLQDMVQNADFAGILDQLAAGTIDLSELGDLSLDQFLRALQQMESLGDAAANAGDSLDRTTRVLNAPRGFRASLAEYRAADDFQLIVDTTRLRPGSQTGAADASLSQLSLNSDAAATSLANLILAFEAGAERLQAGLVGAPARPAPFVPPASTPATPGAPTRAAPTGAPAPAPVYNFERGAIILNVETGLDEDAILDRFDRALRTRAGRGGVPIGVA